MDTLAKPSGFPLPSSLKVVPGTERAQAAYPYYTQFTPADDQRFWFYNSMHFPEPMSAFDMVTAEAAYCALGSANTRVHCLPTTLGIDHRIINGRVYIGGNAVTDPAEIARRTQEFQKRAFYYYENWERLYAQWREKMMALIKDAQALPKPELPEFEPLAHVHAGSRGRLESLSARHLPEDARRVLPDVASPLRVPAARLWRLSDVLRVLQEGLSRDQPTRPSRAWWPASKRRSSGPTRSCGDWRAAPWSSAWMRISEKAPRREAIIALAAASGRTGARWLEGARDLARSLVQHQRRRWVLSLPSRVERRPVDAVCGPARLHRAGQRGRVPASGRSRSCRPSGGSSSRTTGSC